jgi:predicted site-specific integrase-resolvase
MHSRDLADPNRVIWTERDVAHLFGTSCRTVRRWRKAGALPWFRLPGGRIVFGSAEILGHVRRLPRYR